MNKIILTIIIALACCISYATEPITATPSQPITSGQWIQLDTNTSPPMLSGPFYELLTSMTTWTNLAIAPYYIYDTGSKSSGAGLLALYNITPYVATGVGIQYLNAEVWMPSAQVQFQAPLVIGGKLTVTPLAFTGAATPISGRGAENGTLVGIFGAGMSLRLYESSTGAKLSLFGAVAKWTGFRGEQIYGGIAYRF